MDNENTSPAQLEVEPDVDEAVEQAFAAADKPEGSADQSSAAPAPEAESGSGTGRPRDAQGRFTSRTEAATAEPPADEAANSQEQSPPPDSSEQLEPETAEGEVDTSVYPVFSYRANGREYSLPDSLQGRDGIFIPTASVPYLTRILAEAHQNRDFGAELAKYRTQFTGEAEQQLQYAQNLLGALNELRQQGPEAIQAWLEELDRNWETMELKAKLELEQMEREGLLEQQQEFEEEREAEALVPRMQDAVQGYIRHFASQPECAGVDQQRTYERLMNRFFDQLFSEAEDDDPASGIRRGEIVVNWGLIEDEMRYEAALRRGAPGPAAARQPAATSPQKQAPPPVVGAKKGPAPPSKPQIPKFASADEADEWAFGEGMKQFS